MKKIISLIIIVVAIVAICILVSKNVAAPIQQNEVATTTNTTVATSTNSTPTSTPVVENPAPVVTPTPAPAPAPAQPSIGVISPNGGEVWSRNTRQNVQWAYIGLDSNDEVYIAFRAPDQTACWYKSAIVITAGLKHLEIIPNEIRCNDGRVGSLSNGTYKVQIGVTKYNTGQGVADTSDNYFTITN